MWMFRGAVNLDGNEYCSWITRVDNLTSTYLLDIPCTPKVFCGITQASPQGDLRFSGPPSGQGADGGARTRDRRVPADLRADSLATVPQTPRSFICWPSCIAARLILGGQHLTHPHICGF
ncbi:hypothetical protein PoB_006531700 [Plakobranchus ocellatus]|uniref:Uncharacterized protein n=1 Tax=Plakobranchus ocellatus TaxID=259542 RepID=A0AAV4D3S6_9GAST|nr:hypothetical protein PoB_006531700 [Plakobranchus ocellatus]